MPGLGVHFLALDKTISALESTAEGAKIAKNLRRPEAMLGAVGPDLFAFLGKEADWVGKVSETFKFLNTAFDPIFKASDGLSSASGKVLQRLVEDLRKTYEGVVKTFATGVLAKNGGLVFLMKGDLVTNPAIQDPRGFPESGWLWFDLLHWQLTGSIAEGKGFDTKPLSAYRDGYCVHLACDMTGHPYTNSVTGGPARAHAMRHHFAENAMDTWTWDRLVNQEIAGASLNRRIEGVDPAIFEALSAVLKKAYDARQASGGAPLPSPPSKTDLEKAHGDLSKALELVSNLIFYPKPTFPGLWQDLPDPFQMIPEMLGQFPKPERGWTAQDWLLALLKWCELLTKAGLLLLDLMVAIALEAGLYPIRLATWLFQSAVWLLHRALYEILVRIGIAFPLRDSLGDSIVSQFAESPRTADGNYPHKPAVVKSGGWKFNMGYREDGKDKQQEVDVPEAQRSLFYWYPDTLRETATSEATRIILASPYFGRDCRYFLLDPALDVSAYKAYATAKSPAETHQLNLRYLEPTAGLPFGSTVALACFFILGREAAGTIPDWNIDADRAYGFKYWRHSGDLNTTAGFSEGNAYLTNPS